jgi:hypothetical protein
MIILRDKLLVKASFKNHKQKKSADLKKVENQFNNDLKRYNKVSNKIENVKPIKNSNIDRNLQRKAKSLGARVFRDNDNLMLKRGEPSNFPFVAKTDNQEHKNVVKRNAQETGYIDIHKSTKRNAKKLVNSLEKDKYQIRYPKGLGSESLAHEIGHIENDKNNYPKRSGSRDTLVQSKESLKDEQMASKNAVRSLKQSGATKKELKQAKRNLKTFERSYKLNTNLIRSSRKLGQYPIKL